ncbi:MAG: tetratricopeptide repeat protein [Candidatus Obscuribacter sp.]|nr:tetratricopeptide repeat protein [Candidatus Obscuribacter sp.]MBK7837510.1 tetratricopeptide repeat protein [Candidatus Obscuribacter sp.]MBK9206326.1 tetratricopeptide repeat protein [Candidatus Obscuribacter sp.]MBK9618229.1 tetratricopeptide repeat protein [Candidatus Obscuribacter sp.]MBK9771089.1 tetratricopeptide repeat protein [Candidatus Obscuribacter sp.]
MYNESSNIFEDVLSMSSRLLVCALVATLTLSFFASVAHGKTEAECLEAIRVGNRLISENPNNYRGYASRGGAYGYLKKYDLAEKDLLKAISLNRSFAALYAHLARVYYETKRYEQALKASQRAIDLGADFQDSNDALLANLCMARHYDECVKKCNEVLVRFPNDSSAFFYRAISKNELGKFTKSEVVSDLQEAHLLSPDNADFKRIYDLALAGKSIKLKR